MLLMLDVGTVGGITVGRHRNIRFSNPKDKKKNTVWIFLNKRYTIEKNCLLKILKFRPQFCLIFVN